MQIIFLVAVKVKMHADVVDVFFDVFQHHPKISVNFTHRQYDSGFRDECLESPNPWALKMY